MFKYTLDNKRYYTLNYYYKNKYHKKVFKVSLDLGLTCPNIDGKKGYGGCIYCKNGSGYFKSDKLLPLKKQFEINRNMLLKKWPDALYIAYFQSSSNTYGDLNYLKKSFEEVLTYDKVVGINIATRCDCLSDSCLKYLSELNKKCDLTIELGLQTIHEKTAKLINRGHTLKEFSDMMNRLNKLNIKVIVHIINSLPFETKIDMLETVKYLKRFKLFGIKFHMLNILKDTPIEKLYQKKPFHILTEKEYVKILCEQLEYLKEDVVVCRVSADSKITDLIKPKWVMKKLCVLNDIDKEMKKKDGFQGRLYPTININNHTDN